MRGKTALSRPGLQEGRLCLLLHLRLARIDDAKILQNKLNPEMPAVNILLEPEEHIEFGALPELQGIRILVGESPSDGIQDHVSLAQTEPEVRLVFADDRNAKDLDSSGDHVDRLVPEPERLEATQHRPEIG